MVDVSLDTLRGCTATSAASAVRGDPNATAGVGAAGIPEIVEARVAGALDAAGEVNVPVDLNTLVDLLPEEGPRSAADLASWIRTHPDVGRVYGEYVHAVQGSPGIPETGRRERADRYCEAAQDLVGTRLEVTQRWLTFLGVTGSTAYRDPQEGDDCDLMAIVHPGSVWVFLAYVFLRLRLPRRGTAGRSDPVWCFNYTLDEDAAIEEFVRPRGFLFAREALVARPVHGEEFYRGLLRRGEWLREEAPRMYARWESTGLPTPNPPQPAPFPVRFLNALLFVTVAPYLQLKGLWANHRLRRTGRASESFRTLTRLDRMALATARFERLSDRMGPATRLPPE